jgi:hypothetical protein
MGTDVSATEHPKDKTDILAGRFPSISASLLLSFARVLDPLFGPRPIYYHIQSDGPGKRLAGGGLAATASKTGQAKKLIEPLVCKQQLESLHFSRTINALLIRAGSPSGRIPILCTLSLRPSRSPRFSTQHQHQDGQATQVRHGQQHQHCWWTLHLAIAPVVCPHVPAVAGCGHSRPLCGGCS